MHVRDGQEVFVIDGMVFAFLPAGLRTAVLGFGPHCILELPNRISTILEYPLQRSQYQTTFE